VTAANLELALAVEFNARNSLDGVLLQAALFRIQFQAEPFRSIQNIDY